MTTKNLERLNQTQFAGKNTVSSAGRIGLTLHNANINDYDATTYIDQQDVINSGEKTIAVGSSDTQTITPSTSGLITEFTLFGRSDANTYIICSITDTITGRYIGTISMNVSSGSEDNPITGIPTHPIYLSASSQYTFTLYNAPSNFFYTASTAYLVYDATGSYTGGSMGSNPSQDYYFQLEMRDASVVNFPSCPINDVVTSMTDPGIFSGSALITAFAVSQFVDSYIYNYADFTRLNNYGDLSSTTWFCIGYIDTTLMIRGKIISEVNILNITTAEVSTVKFTTSFNLSPSQAYKFDYEIVTGNISAIRPLFRVYQTSSAGNIYIDVKIQSGCKYKFNNYLYDIITQYMDNVPISLRTVTNEGTGTDPNNASGKILRYDSSVDDAGLPAPKTATATAPFWTSSQTMNLSFSRQGNHITMDLDSISVNANNSTNGVVTFAAGTIPTKWCPSNTEYFTVHAAITSTNITYAGSARVFTDGSIILTVITGATTIFANYPAVSGFAQGWNKFTLSWIIKNT